MFKMKYLVNKMQSNILLQQVGWLDGKGGLMINVFISILKVKGSNLTSGVCVVDNGKLTKYSPI